MVCVLGLVIASMRAAEVLRHVSGRLLARGREGADSALVDRTLVLHGARVHHRVGGLAISVLEVPEASSEAVLQSLRQTGVFEFVEYDSYAHTAAEIPNDPSYGAQWHLAKIQSPGAWSVTTGSAAVVVAVIDSGVYGIHPDLMPKLVAGWNFVDSTANTTDQLGHGTAVAGTVAAASNNGIGVAGVSWASRIMPLVVVDANDLAAYSDLAAAVVFAADHGVRVINISAGGPDSSLALQAAVDYAWSKGAVIFASAMNNSVATPYYPAACEHVVAVSATDSNDHLAAFSNYGNWITLAAPGTNILTTMNGGGYGYWFGTSFASPIVAGVAALCLAVNPSLTNAELVALLEDSADDLGAPGYDTAFGWGRVNAYRAVRLAAPASPPARRTPRRYPSR